VYATERQQEILSRARQQGRVDVKELADSLEVTPETVRRDLTALERLGLVRRVHGGAIPVERLGIEPAVADRVTAAAAPAPQRLSEPESATGMLQLAQKLHDDYVRAGQEEGERIINEARAQATRIVAEAEETSARTLSALEQERSLLERKIDELRVFERDYRTRLKSYLENLLGDLESRSATVQPRQPGEGPSFNG